MSFFDFYEQQTFKDLVNSEEVYVDKTGQICELYRTHTTFELLTRPLGFGKTMLIDTITNLFRHKYTEFFAELAVASSDVKFPEQKVMRLDFSLNNASLGSTLEDYLRNYYRTRAFENNLRTEINRDDNIYWQTSAYVKSLAEVSPSGKIVVLIDNYDYPILKNLFKPAATTYYKTLLEFLRALSDNEPIIDWCLITGETKFYLSTSDQEGLCYVKDLTFEGTSTHICGFTEGEMRNYFNDFLQDEADCAGMTTEEFMSQLYDWYGNYRLTEQNIRVMRPESICKFLNLRDQNEYRSFYDADHVEIILETILKKSGRNPERLLMPASCGYNFCEYSSIDNVRPFALLFQLGFFSLDHIDIDLSRTPPLYGYYSKITNREMLEFYQKMIRKLGLPELAPLANKNRRKNITEGDASAKTDNQGKNKAQDKNGTQATNESQGANNTTNKNTTSTPSAPEKSSETGKTKPAEKIKTMPEREEVSWSSAVSKAQNKNTSKTIPASPSQNQDKEKEQELANSPKEEPINAPNNNTRNATEKEDSAQKTTIKKQESDEATTATTSHDMKNTDAASENIAKSKNTANCEHTAAHENAAPRKNPGPREVAWSIRKNDATL